MKKKILAVAVIVICLAILASGTLAYYTTDAIARNVITTGFVEIELVEKHIDGNGAVVDFPDAPITGVMPGSTVSKIVSVKNIGAESWIRISVEKRVTGADGAELPTDVVSFTVDESKWLLKDGYYYHLEPVDTEASTGILFDEVTFAPTMGNEYQNCKTEIIVYAQAVQTANNGTTVEEAAGWPAGEELPLA